MARPGSAASIGSSSVAAARRAGDGADAGGHLDRGVVVVDRDRPAAAGQPAGRLTRRPVDGPHLRPRVRRHRRGVEGGVLDVVAHGHHEVRAERLHVDQRTAVVEPELAVVGVGRPEAEVHELRRRPMSTGGP